MFGGWGNDLLDADDDKGTNGGANDAPDGPVASYEDLAFGGTGRDVLIANTGGDRLIDWIGEFNSFLVPFAPFGAFTITRAVPPQIFQFLYDLSEAEGTDPTRGVEAGNPERHGKPDGELGLITQKDDAWQAQTGAPIDPQPGNIPGGKRDVLRGADFNSGPNATAQGFAADSGTWTVEAGGLTVAPETLDGDAVSVFHVGEYLPIYFEVSATINAVKPTGGYKANAYIIFDYQNETDFKFAGVNISTDKLEMGHRDADGWHTDAQVPAQLKPEQEYLVLLALNGTTATLRIDNEQVFTHVFSTRTDPDGFTYGLNSGLVGFGAQGSKAKLDNLTVQVLPPRVTLEIAEDFEDTVQDIVFDAQSGLWLEVGGEYMAETDLSGVSAISLIDLGSVQNLAAGSYLELNSTMNIMSSGGFVFDYYATDDFKYITLDADTDQVMIGYNSPKHGWVVSTSVDYVLESGVDYDVTIILKDTTVSVTIDGNVVLGYAFNADIVDGRFGLLSYNGLTSFGMLTVKTDDSAFLDEGDLAYIPPALTGTEETI